MIDFESLRVWNSFHEFTLIVYHQTLEFPAEEQYGLTLQMRRTAVSIGSNIAEGCGRQSDAELHKFLIIAMGSASKLEYQLMLAKDLEYISIDEYQTLEKKLVSSK
jgi:four helix bundle protein